MSTKIVQDLCILKREIFDRFVHSIDEAEGHNIYDEAFFTASLGFAHECLGIKLGAVAEAVGVTSVAVGLWKNDRTMPSAPKRKEVVLWLRAYAKQKLKEFDSLPKM